MNKQHEFVLVLCTFCCGFTYLCFLSVLHTHIYTFCIMSKRWSCGREAALAANIEAKSFCPILQENHLLGTNTHLHQLLAFSCLQQRIITWQQCGNLSDFLRENAGTFKQGLNFCAAFRCSTLVHMSSHTDA